MIASILSVLLGAVLLYLGGEGLVAGASRLALRLRLTPLTVGLTVVAFGTSAPELVVSLRASAAGMDGLALGNVVGSNLCNLGLILGLAALVRPPHIHSQVLRFDVPVLIVVSVGFVALTADGRLSRLEGGLLVVGLVAYVLANVRLSRGETASVDPGAVLPLQRGAGVLGELGLVVVGLVVLVAGAQVFVHGATALARASGVSEAVIGLTVVAVGTSLPELATSVVAAVRGEGDIAVGNVVGSNLFNLLGIAGIAGVVRPMTLGGIGAIDLAALALSPILLLPLFLTGRRFSRGEGALVLGLYAAWVAWLGFAG